MANTRREFIDDVLDNLGLLVFGQAPSDEMVSRVDKRLDKAFAQLAREGTFYVSDPGTPSPPTGGDFEDDSYLELVNWVSFAVASPFGLGADPSLKVLQDQARERLLQMGRPAVTRRTLTTDPQLRGGRGLRGTGNFSRGT